VVAEVAVQEGHYMPLLTVLVSRLSPAAQVRRSEKDSDHWQRDPSLDP